MLQHPNVVELLDVTYMYQERRLYLIFEFVEYDLRKHLDAKWPLPLNEVKRIVH
jgi:serine/threonine protein kinase